MSEQILLETFRGVLEDVLDEMTPGRMVRHLAEAGWVYSSGRQHDNSMMWRLFRGPTVHGRVTVPTQPTDDDYRSRMREAVLAVMVAEGWVVPASMVTLFPRDLRPSVI